MSIRLSLDFKDVETLVKRLNIADDALDKEMRAAMQKSVDLVEAQVVGRTPVNTGQLRQSIGTEIRGRGLSIEGRVMTPLAYGLVMERGRRPGKAPPPVEAIRLWVERKGIASGEEAAGVAYVIARSIGRKGIKGRRMFKEGLKAAEPKVLNLWRGVPGRFLARSFGG